MNFQFSSCDLIARPLLHLFPISPEEFPHEHVGKSVSNFDY